MRCIPWGGIWDWSKDVGGDLYRTYQALFKGKAKGRKRKGSRWIRAKQTQENEEGRVKEPIAFKQEVGQFSCLAQPNSYTPSCLLIKLHSYLLPVWSCSLHTLVSSVCHMLMNSKPAQFTNETRSVGTDPKEMQEGFPQAAEHRTRYFVLPMFMRVKLQALSLCSYVWCQSNLYSVCTHIFSNRY